MKKIIVGIILLLALTACDSINYKVKLHTGDIRITETSEYIITEQCIGFNGFKKPRWKKVSVERKVAAEQAKEENK